MKGTILFFTLILGSLSTLLNNSLSKSTTNNCSTYGPLTHGVVAWGLDFNNKQIPGSTTNSNNGQEAITIFTEMFQKFPETSVICFSPKRINC